MTFRDIFCIVELCVFFVGTIGILMYYFCINPVYEWFKNPSATFVCIFVLLQLYYILSILSVIIEVIFGGHVGADGVTFYQFTTAVSLAIPALLLFGTGVYWFIYFLKYLGRVHEGIRQRRMGE